MEKNKIKKSKLIVDENEEKLIKEEKHEEWDHYHGIHHITKDGEHDHIESNEFKLQLQWKLTKSQLIFKMALTGMFLALSFAVAGIDIAFELIRLPINGDLWLEFRFLDITLICISIAVLGPIFASVISLLSPWIHSIVHGFEHGTITPAVDMLSDLVIVWVVWLVFYFAFQNSPIHKEPNKKKAIFKRFVPLPILIVISALVTAAFFALALKLTSNISVSAQNSEEGGEIHFSDLNTIVFLTVFAWNLLKYTAAFLIFNTVEWRMRPINHRYSK